jgi:hypothetical protein
MNKMQADITEILRRVEKIITECDWIKHEIQQKTEKITESEIQTSSTDPVKRIEDSQQASTDQFNITIKQSDYLLFSRNFHRAKNPVSLWFNASGMAGFSITDTDHYVCNNTDELNAHKSKFKNDMIFFISYSKFEKLFLRLFQSESSGEVTPMEQTFFYSRKYTITKKELIIENSEHSAFSIVLGKDHLEFWFNEHDKKSGFSFGSIDTKGFTCSSMDATETAALTQEFKRMDPLDAEIKSITLDVQEYPRKVALKKLNTCDVNLIYEVNE